MWDYYKESLSLMQAMEQFSSAERMTEQDDLAGLENCNP
jgi:hypothetical protein